MAAVGEALGAREAVRQGSRSLTYRQLAAAVAGLEAGLRRHGVGRGRLVAVTTEDRFALVPAMLAVLRRGAVFVPLDPGVPRARLSALLTAVRPDAIVSDRAAGPSVTAAAANGETAAPIALGEGPLELLLHGRTGARRRRWPSPRRFDYVTFTSGSTGRPKGICGRLAGISQLVEWEISRLGFEAGRRVAQLVVPTFDPYLRDVFVPLCSGGTVCIPPLPPNRADPSDLLRWVDEERIALVHTVPSLLAGWLRSAGRCGGLGFADLEWMLLSGEPLPSATVCAWRRMFGTRTRFMNLYGVSEATMFQLGHEVTARDLKRAWLPIGTPVPGWDVELRRADGTTPAVGEPGEVVVRSRYLALGYLDDLAASRAAFEKADANGARAYRTGDLAVRLADGALRLKGRRDGQLKVCGVRVECSEVEATLSRHPLVGACAVVAVGPTRGAFQLAAFVQPRFHDPPGVPQLRRFLSERLPWEMVPARFVVRDVLPRLANGKLDRAALASEAVHTTACAPRGAATADRWVRDLGRIWSEALALPAVGPEADFFELGGHSLAAVTVAMRVQRSFGVSLSLSDLFARPRLGDLAAHVRRLVGAWPGRLPSRGSVAPSPRAAAKREAAPSDGFRCPTRPSPWFGRRRCALLLVVNEQLEPASFARLAGLVHAWDPSIEAIVHTDGGARPRLPDLPTLVVAPASIRHPLGTDAPVFSGSPLAKSEELERLAAAGISVPDWVVLRAGDEPETSHLGDYVVRKPDYGAKGARVQIVKRTRLRWKALETEAGGPSAAIVAQRFVYTGPRPVSFRVNTLFGRVLFAVRLEGNPRREALAGPGDFGASRQGRMVSIVSNARDSIMARCDDAAVIRFGEAAAAAFPECPLLGVDVLREHGTGLLFALEVNAIGYNWNFTSRERAEWPFDPALQFDGERKAAWLLAERTQRLAR